MADNDVSLKTGVPVVMPYISPQWIPYVPNPATTQGFGTLGTNNLFYKQVGADMHIQGRIQIGTPTAVEARLGLPVGFTVGSSLGSGIGVLMGNWYSNTASASVRKVGAVLSGAGQNYLNFTATEYTITGGAYAAQVADNVFVTSSLIGFYAIVPIAEFASTAYQAYGAGLATASRPGLVAPWDATSTGGARGGTYSPIIGNGTNVTSSATSIAKWTQIGPIVTVTGRFDATCATAGNTTSVAGISLPIASNFTLTSDLDGTGSRNAVSGTPFGGAVLSADTSTKQARIDFVCTEATTRTVFYTFQYIIK